MNKALSIAALAISIAALVMAMDTRQTDGRIAQEMIDRREQQLIETLWPGIQRFYEDIGVPKHRLPEHKPVTLEELLLPAFETVLKGDD